MNKSQNFKLIQGTFSATEASQVLFELIGSKIHFHSMENFSFQERFGKDKPNSKSRIKALKKIQASLKKYFEIAEQKNLQLKIEGIVEITIVK